MINATGCIITLYTQDGCADSAAVRSRLNEQGVPFIERNVTNDPSAAVALARTGIFATPLVAICAHKVFGNRPQLIASTIETCEFLQVV
ncbi:hypothetical protein BH23CHL4_BH23CHL4_25960 [soil metagenome]